MVSQHKSSNKKAIIMQIFYYKIDFVKYFIDTV